MLNEFARILSMELTNVMGEITPITNAIIPDFVSDIFGKMLTVIAPVWNPIWTAFSDLLNTLFGF